MRLRAKSSESGVAAERCRPDRTDRGRPKGSGKVGIINQSTEAGWLPQIGGYKYLLTILVVAVLTVLVYIYLNYSKHGYEISVVGESERTARYVGIKVGKVIVRTMLLSGALCGIAGVLLVSGTDL